MKLVNLLLSIFIFLMAAVSAGFSYLLFEKRNELLSGWSLLAQSVSQTAKSLDEGTGSKLSDTLKEEMLGHENFNKLENNVKLLPEHAKKVISQRDDLAKSLVKAIQTFDVGDSVSLSELQELEKSPAGREKVQSIISSIKSRNDKTRSLIKSHADKVGVSLDTDSLKNNPESELEKLGSKLEDIKNRLTKYNESLQAIAGSAGVSSPDFTGSDYAESLESIQSAIGKLRSDYNSTKKQLASKTSQVASLTNTVKNKNKVISSKDGEIKDRNEQINKLKQSIFGPQGGELEDLWKDGSKKARQAVKGRIIEVNRKYGFAVVDLGSKSKVKQFLTKDKVNEANPKIPKDCEMTVARGLDSGNGEYIGKVKLVRIHDNCSIAHVVDPINKELRIGDVVYFSDKQIDAIADNQGE